MCVNGFDYLATNVLIYSIEIKSKENVCECMCERENDMIEISPFVSFCIEMRFDFVFF